MSRLLYRLLRPLMRGVEERMILRLLNQRDRARQEVDLYRQAAGMKTGEFLEGTGN